MNNKFNKVIEGLINDINNGFRKNPYQTNHEPKDKPKDKPKKNDYALFQKTLESYLGCKVDSEVLFAKELKRKFRFDFALQDSKIAIEIEGGIFTNGRHTRGKGFMNDMLKYNLATRLGWVILRYTPQQLNKTSTFEEICSTWNMRKDI